MSEEKKAQIIQEVKNMPECHVYKLEAFLSGLHAGKQIGTKKTETEQQSPK